MIIDIFSIELKELILLIYMEKEIEIITTF